jgi:hypothetical protein
MLLEVSSDSLPQATGHDSEKKFRPPEAWRNKFATLPKDIPTLEILLQVGSGQCCGSVTFWYGCGSADPCLCPMVRILVPIFVLDLQDAKVHLHHFSKTKSHKIVTKQ